MTKDVENDKYVSKKNIDERAISMTYVPIIFTKGPPKLSFELLVDKLWMLNIYYLP